MSSIRKFFHTRKRNKLIALVVALLVVGIGYTLVLTKAAGFFASVTPNTASLSGNATLVSESDGTQAIQFNGPQGGGTDPTPVPGGSGPDLSKKDCIVKPSACGYPDETNTGYKPTGVTLTTAGISYNSDKDFVIDKDGTVIDSKRIDGCVLVTAKNVTIKRSLLTGCKGDFNVRLLEPHDTANFLMEDVEVDGNNYKNNAAIVDDNDRGGFVIRRMNMHNVADGIHPGFKYLMEDSYIHDMYVCPDDCHTDTVQSAGAYDVTIRHNTIKNNPANNGTGGKNAVVRIATEQGPVDTFIVDNNLLEGGNYSVQLRRPPLDSEKPRIVYAPIKNIKITNNRIVPTWRFGPYDFFDDQTQDTFTSSTVTALSGNVRDDTLVPLNTIQ